MDGSINGWIDECTNRWIGGMYYWMDGWMDGWIDGWMEWMEWIDGWMDGQMDVLMDGQIDRWMEWTYSQVYLLVDYTYTVLVSVQHVTVQCH